MWIFDKGEKLFALFSTIFPFLFKDSRADFDVYRVKIKIN